MLKHRVDSIKERKQRESEQRAIKEDLDFLSDCTAELGVLIAEVLEAQKGGASDGENQNG